MPTPGPGLPGFSVFITGLAQHSGPQPYITRLSLRGQPNYPVSNPAHSASLGERNEIMAAEALWKVKRYHTNEEVVILLITLFKVVRGAEKGKINFTTFTQPRLFPLYSLPLRDSPTVYSVPMFSRQFFPWLIYQMTWLPADALTLVPLWATLIAPLLSKEELVAGAHADTCC